MDTKRILSEKDTPLFTPSSAQIGRTKEQYIRKDTYEYKIHGCDQRPIPQRHSSANTLKEQCTRKEAYGYEMRQMDTKRTLFVKDTPLLTPDDVQKNNVYQKTPMNTKIVDVKRDLFLRDIPL